MEKLRQTLSNYVWMPILLTIGFIGWGCNLDFITVPLLCVYVGLLLAFCDDVRNLFPVAFSVPFFINTIEGFIDYVILGIGILFFIIGLVIFLIRHLWKKKTPVKKGKLFWGFVISLAAYLLGGIWGYFNIINAIIITAMTSATYFLYWIAINFTHNFRKYINSLFIAIGIILFVQLLISYANVDEPFGSAILSKNVVWIGLQNINVAAIYFMLAMLAAFQFALHHKYDYLITLAGLFFAICTYFTYSRMGTLICFIIMIISIIYIFAKSKNKPIFLFIGIVGVFILEFICVLYFDKIAKLFSHHVSLGFSGNGRDALWPWCIEKFFESPLFGVGYTSKDPVPGLLSTKSIILAHNTLIQYLTSLGIIGTIMMIYYHIQRYKILLTNFNEFKFMNLLNILTIGLSGITDQSPTMDIFIICIATIFIAQSELDSEEHSHNNLNTKTTESNTTSSEDIEVKNQTTAKVTSKKTFSTKKVNKK